MVSAVSLVLLASTASAFVIPFNSAESSTANAGSFHSKSSPAIVPRQGQLPDMSDGTAQLIYIAPSSASCDNAPAAGECATASQAVQPLLASFSKYGVSSTPEQAALLSWIAYETAELKYVKNHFPAPGRPGQGTRTMMMPNFVQEYAASIGITDGGDAANILDKVIAAGQDWGSAGWFYKTKCSDSIKSQVQSGGRAGWQAFVTQCVQTTMDDGRVKYWERAMLALGGTTN